MMFIIVNYVKVFESVKIIVIGGSGRVGGSAVRSLS